MKTKQKHVILTGASRGFGRDLAFELADEKTTIHLIVRSDVREMVAELEATGVTVQIWKQDLVDNCNLRDLLEKIAQQVKNNDCRYVTLINNAGLLDPIGPAGKYDIDTYRENLEVNYVAPLLLAHAFIELFQQDKMVKRVVMISSGAASKPYFGWSHYCSTKAGVDMFVKVVGIEQEQQPHPVDIIAFNPGRIATDMQVKIRDTSEVDFPMVHDFISAWKDGRVGDSREVAGRLARLIYSEYVPSGKTLSHRDI